MAQHSISINGSTAADDDLFDMEWRKFRRKQDYAEPVFIWIVSVIEIPIMILTLIGLRFIIKSWPAASVFVSHLILSFHLYVNSSNNLMDTETVWCI